MNCPVCNSTTNKLLHSITSEESVQHVIQKTDRKFLALRDHVEFLWQSKSCNIFQCESCDLVFSSPFIAGDKDFYNLIYDSKISYPIWRWEFDMTIEILTQSSIKDLKLLEIGAGDGSFIKKIADRLVTKSNIYSTEFSDIGIKEMTNFGIKCLQYDIRDSLFLQYKNKFDIVCMFQILEHLDNLDDFFNVLNYITSISAVLFIGVPNDKHRSIYEKGGIILDFPPIHLTRWNYSSVHQLANKYNWVILDHKIQSEKIVSNIYCFVVEYFEKKMEISKTINDLRNTIIRKTLKFLFYFYILIIKFRFIPKLLTSNLGRVQWFYLRKIN